MITRKELIKKYIDFFKSKGHKEIPNSSLIPTNDPTGLFTTAGMHPLVPYLLGEKHPLGKRLVNVQRCIRTVDIDEVGDSFHHTFFEMLGNWSLGDYWKKEAIEMTFEFHTEVLKIPIEKYAVTVFSGNKEIKRDEESLKAWLSLGIPKERIALLDNNWWPSPESKATGPCGPDTEMFYWTSKNVPAPKKYNPNDKRWVEIGNDVLIEYNKTEEGKFIPLKQKNIDFGGGVERTLAVLNSFDDNYLTEMWQPIIKKIEQLSGKKYKGNEKAMRIIADHIKASVFIIADGIVPSNTGQGYVLRRLIRRAVRYGKKINLFNFAAKVTEPIFKIYNDYKELDVNRNKIIEELKKEEERFNQTIEKGFKEFNKIVTNKTLSGEDAFLLYQSYGFPIELTQEMAKEKGIKVDVKGFEQQLSNHQELSRTATKGKFASGLADHSATTTRLHTATHLLNEALRRVLGQEVRQRGSNITPERLRFDFNFPRKLTEAEVSKVENLVNEKIKENLKVIREEMPLKKALSSGAQAEFGARYPEIVSVYSIGNFSKEICTGPHVKHTGKIGKFKIIKEESSAAGIRRIKAVVE